MSDPLPIAITALRTLIDTELAVVWPEVEGKMSGRRNGRPGYPYGLYPDLLTKARRALLKSGEIRPDTTTSHGGHSITVYTPGATGRRKTAISKAAARKRRLMAHVRSWQQYFGREAENVVHQTLLSLAPLGYMPVNPSPVASEISLLFGKPVRSGRFDDVVHFTPQDSLGRPSAPVTLLIEVKSLRDFIYPDAPELYDLLHKAACMTQDHQGVPFLPILICREAVYDSMAMAKELGFFIVQMYAQFIPRIQEIPDSQLEDVRNILHLDIERIKDPPIWKPMANLLSKQMSNYAAQGSQRWSATAPALVGHFQTLRNPSLPTRARINEMQALATACRDLGLTTSWFA